MERQHGDETVDPKMVSTHIYGDTLPSKSTGSTDAVNVIFTISAYQAAAR